MSTQINNNKVIEIIEGVIEDLEMVGPLILRYKKEPLIIGTGIVKFYTIQKAEELKSAIKILKGEIKDHE